MPSEEVLMFQAHNFEFSMAWENKLTIFTLNIP
jgi:hypothetical protein